MEKAFLKKTYGAVSTKVEMVDKSLVNYAIRAILSGMFLALIYTFCMQIVSDFSGTMVEPLGKLAMSYLFGIALLFIVYFGAELFTSNTMYMTIGTTHKKTKWTKLLKVFVFCWFFNFVGAGIGAWLLVQTGIFNEVNGVFPNDSLYTLAAKKATSPLNEVFFRGILANWVVCAVVYVASVCKEDIAKIMAIPLGLVPFVYLGFEHSIANFGVFWMTWLTPGAADAASYHDMAFTTMGAFQNLGAATLGNIVGGAVFVGCYFAFLHRKEIGKEIE